MQRLSSDQLEHLAKRHHDFNDSLIRRVEFRFLSGVPGRHVSVALEVQDRESKNGWGEIHFEFHDVTEFSLLEDNTTNVVLSSGIMWTLRPNLVVADFSPVHADDQRSTFLIAARAGWFLNSADALKLPRL